ncbi:hypothetical protein ACHAXS_006701 [Conticribra weissflogii]
MSWWHNRRKNREVNCGCITEWTVTTIASFINTAVGTNKIGIRCVKDSVVIRRNFTYTIQSVVVA